MLSSHFSSNYQLRRLTAAISFLLFIAFTATQAQTGTTTFGQFFQRDTSAQNFNFVNNNGTFNTIAGGNPVYFSYGGIVGLSSELQGIQNATITMTSTTNSAATSSGGSVTQPINQTLVIAIIRDTPTVNVGINTRRNLLTATVNINQAAAAITGSGNAATYSASTPTQNVQFTSDFLVFSGTNGRNLALSLSSVTPAIGISATNGFINSFLASGSGTFASDPPPTIITTASSVNISGRILTTDGRAVNRAQITLTDSNGDTRVAYSNGFGYYRFAEVQGGQTVVLSVSSKRYTFASQVVSVTDELTGVNFTALE